MGHWTDKRVMVTGGHGFFGSHVCDALWKAGAYSVCVPARDKYDLRKPDAVQEAIEHANPDVIIHLAASVGGIGANRDKPGEFFYDNALMGIHVINEARRYGVEKLVVVGTVCSYPKHTPTPFHESDLWNGFPEETNAPYGIAKKALLVQALAYREQYGLNTVFVMPTNLYGPRDDFDPSTSHVIPALIRKFYEAKANGEGHVELWGDGTPTREFLYVEDAAQGLLRVAESYRGADPINLGSGQEISIAELARMVKLLTGYKGQTTWNTGYPNGQPRRCLDTSRARDLLGWEAQTPLEVGLQATVDWFKEHVLAKAWEAR